MAGHKNKRNDKWVLRNRSEEGQGPALYEHIGKLIQKTNSWCHEFSSKTADYRQHQISGAESLKMIEKEIPINTTGRHWHIIENEHHSNNTH